MNLCCNYVCNYVCEIAMNLCCNYVTPKTIAIISAMKIEVTQSFYKHAPNNNKFIK